MNTYIGRDLEEEREGGGKRERIERCKEGSGRERRKGMERDKERETDKDRVIQRYKREGVVSIVSKVFEQLSSLTPAPTPHTHTHTHTHTPPQRQVHE